MIVEGGVLWRCKLRVCLICDPVTLVHDCEVGRDEEILRGHYRVSVKLTFSPQVSLYVNLLGDINKDRIDYVGKVLVEKL